jgi:hypothetical protein
MSGKARGISLVVAGVLANNYVYLHDLVTNKHDGMIHVGLWSAAGILVALGVVAVGLSTLARSVTTTTP